MPNVHHQARTQAWFIEFLADYLDGGPGFNPKNPFMLSGTLTDDEAECLQRMIDNPPKHIDPETLPDRVIVPLAALLELASERVLGARPRPDSLNGSEQSPSSARLLAAFHLGAPGGRRQAAPTVSPSGGWGCKPSHQNPCTFLGPRCGGGMGSRGHP